MPSERGLGRRFFRRIAFLSVGLVLVSGAVEGLFGYRQARQAVAQSQALQVQAARTEIDQYLRTLLRTLQHVQELPWGLEGFGATQRRQELHRLLALNPSIVRVVDVDGGNQEMLAVSRTLPDVVDSRQVGPALQLGADGQAVFGTPSFDRSGTPFVEVCVGPTTPLHFRTVVTIDLRFLADVASGLRVASGGEVYVVDRDGWLLAHADPTKPLARSKVAGAAALNVLRRPEGLVNGGLMAVDSPGLDGEPAITSTVKLATVDWAVFIQQPRHVALRPLAESLQRTSLLVVLAGILAMVGSGVFARRMAAPIRRLREATAAMASGRHLQHLTVDTGDEIQGLAEDFNAMSERLQQSYRELEHKVEQRTAELALRRDEAERANAAKTRFLASASHDLRQPMHAIGLLVELLRARVQAPEQQALADKTHQAVQSMEALFGSLLDISKLDAGAIKPQMQAVALQSLLNRVSATHAPLAQAKGLQWRVRSTRLATHTDPALLERIVGNLAANAVRYTTRGGVLLACRTRGDTVALQVVDTGVGIAADRLDLVFEEFVRLDDGMPGDKGLGLGLAIVRRTAQLLDIEVAVRSRPGRGSTFEVLLPRLDKPQEADPTPPHVAGSALNGAFVLMVDDDVVNLEATASLLQNWGCLVATARHADAAVEEAARHLRHPDVVVTDLRLGAGDHGLALIRRLRAQTAGSLPAVLVTADVQLPQPVDADVQVLRKPCGAAALHEALLRVLQPAAGPIDTGT